MTTVWARAMLAELVAGNRDAPAMSDLAQSKLRRKIPDLIEALTGHFDDYHALLVGAKLHRPDHVQEAVVELDATIAAALTPWANDLELLIWVWPCPKCGGIIAAWEPHSAGEHSLRRR